MFMPWIGLFEQVRLADVFIHYDDVQLPQGRSFMSRVQVQSVNGISWLTAPIDHAKSGRLLNETMLIQQKDWRRKHLNTIRHSYAKRPHFSLMFELAQEIYSQASNCLADFNIAGIEKVATWLGLAPKFLRSSEMDVMGASTERLVGLCEAANCDVYITGHGALGYLNYQKFEEKGISVRYIDYRKVPYEQGHESFTPYVSILDAIANCGESTRDLLCSEAIYWRDFNVS
jgi:hypothetical protein